MLFGALNPSNPESLDRINPSTFPLSYLTFTMIAILDLLKLRQLPNILSFSSNIVKSKHQLPTVASPSSQLKL